MDCNVCFVSIIILLFVVYKVVDRLLRLSWVGRYGERYVFITGCDTGFGHDLARRLDSRGCHVFAACLTEKGETELKKISSDRLQTIQLDVAKPENVRKAFLAVKERLEKDGKDLWAVVNNAGVTGPVGPPEWQTVDDYRNTAAVNLYGLIDVTMTFLPLVKKSRGRVVNISSIAGRFSTEGSGTYSVSKYGVEAFMDGLRRSLRPYGCKASLIEPGAYRTPMTTMDSMRRTAQKTWDSLSQETRDYFGEDYLRFVRDELPAKAEPLFSDKTYEVIDAYEHAILGRYPRARYLVGLQCTLLWIPLQALPEWLSDWMLDTFMGSRTLPAAIRNDVSGR